MVRRLLADYPTDVLTILTGSHYLKSAPSEERLNCRHIVFPTSNETGAWGLGRVKFLLSWLLMPLLVIVGIYTISRRNVNAVLTVADGHFFLAAALASVLTSTPLVLIVHDDWVDTQKQDSYVIRYFCRAFFRFALRSSSHIYAVSPSMQKMLQEQFDVETELQLPATESHKRGTGTADMRYKSDTFRILYAGVASDAVIEGLNLVVKTIKSGTLCKLGLGRCELHTYMPISAEEVRRLGWEHEDVKTHDWVSQQELPAILQSADCLFLPYSFSENLRFFTERSFPSKVADYLAALKPILVLSPSYASIVNYARRYGFAEIVDEPSEDALSKGILHVRSDRCYRDSLIENAQKVFSLNHNVAVQRDNFRQLIHKLVDRIPQDAGDILAVDK